jgi:hypothetical protein
MVEVTAPCCRTQAKATAATDAPSSSLIWCSVSRMSSRSGAGLQIVPGQNLVARCSQVSTFRTGRRRRAGSRGLRPGRVPWRCRIARLPGFAVAATIRPVSSARRTSGPSAVQSPLETLISLVVLVAGRPVPRPQVPRTGPLRIAYSCTRPRSEPIKPKVRLRRSASVCPGNQVSGGCGIRTHEEAHAP